MSVYAYRLMEQLQTSLQTLSSNMNAKTLLILTGKEFLAAFVSPEHLTMLKEVQEICRPATGSYTSTSLESVDGEKISVSVAFSGEAPVILPQYVKHGLQPTCPGEVREKISAWVEQRISFGNAFGDVKDAMAYLNDNCGDSRAMALMLPCFATVMGGISEDAESTAVKRAKKLTNVKGFGSLPRLPIQVRQRIAEASAVVNASMLMNDAALPTTKRHDAVFSFYQLERHTRPNIFSKIPDDFGEYPPASPVSSFL
jgi:hypothetical protein